MCECSCIATLYRAEGEPQATLQRLCLAGKGSVALPFNLPESSDSIMEGKDQLGD